MRKIAFPKIDRIKGVEPTLVTGKWGTGDLNTWFPADFSGNKRDKIFFNEQPRSKLRGILIELKKKCYNVFPINPNAEKIEGDKCYPDLLSLTLKNLCSL